MNDTESLLARAADADSAADEAGWDRELDALDALDAPGDLAFDPTRLAVDEPELEFDEDPEELDEREYPRYQLMVVLLDDSAIP